MSASYDILGDLFLLLALGVATIIAFHRLRLPPIVGLLMAGVLCGPHGLALVRSTEEVKILAEVGVMLLLFTVGIEFSLEKLLRLRWLLFLGGGLQVGATVAVGTALARAAGVALPKAVFLGMLLGLSSTAIVVRILSEKGEVDTPYGRACVAILIFQDLCIVPMVLLTPYLAGGTAGGTSPVLVGAKALAFVAGSVVAARYVVPMVFRLAVLTRRREVFVLTVAMLCLGAAWLSAEVGLSLALGAFIAGLIISQSEYSVQALGDALPFREVFNSFFFISVGLLLDLGAVADHFLWVAGSVAAIIALKGTVAGASAFALGYPLKVAAAVGLTLSQIGEFSFVLSRAGIEAGLLGPQFDQIFLASAVITMALTPGMHSAGRWMQDRVGWPAQWRLPVLETEPLPRTDPGRQSNHVLIVGYGVNGRNLSRVLTSAGVPFEVVETNPFTVSSERKKGVPIHYGDATVPETLVHAGVENARVLVVAVSDAAATRRVVVLARRLNPLVHIIARTRYVQEVPDIISLGAREVIPEEFETSVEIFARVLALYLVPREEIDRSVREVREGAYEMLRSPGGVERPLEGIRHLLQDISFEVFRIEEGSQAAGRTLREIQLRRVTGGTMVALEQKGGKMKANPAADEPLEPGALAVVLGRADQLRASAQLFRRQTGGSPFTDRAEA